MYFQPMVDAAAGRLTNVEALVRWNHPELGLLMPDAFIELVSLAGFTDDLLEVAVRQGISVLSGLPDDVGVAVNLTAHDVRSPTLADRCAALLAEQQIGPQRLTFEITVLCRRCTRLGRAAPGDCIRGKGIARPEQPREPKQSWRAQARDAWS